MVTFDLLITLNINNKFDLEDKMMNKDITNKLAEIREKRKRRIQIEESKKSTLERVLSYIENIRSQVEIDYHGEDVENCKMKLLEDFINEVNVGKSIYCNEEDINIHFIFCIGITGAYFSNWFESTKIPNSKEDYISFDTMLSILQQPISQWNWSESYSKYIELICSYVKEYHKYNDDECVRIFNEIEMIGEDYWITYYFKLIQHLTKFGDVLLKLQLTGNNTNYNEYILLLWDYLDRLPYEFRSYLIKNTDKLYRAIKDTSDSNVTQSTALDFVPFPTIPLLLNAMENYESDIVNHYETIRNYKIISSYYDTLRNEMEKKHNVDIEDGRISFKNKLIDIDSKLGLELYNLIEKLENSDQKTFRELPRRVRLYFYTAEALYNVMKNNNIDKELELSFLCVNYIKGMETFLADGISAIIKELDIQNINKIDPRSGDAKEIEKLECGSLVYFISRNETKLIKEGAKWGKLKNGSRGEELQGFAKKFYFEWVKKIRNGKMHKSPVLKNHSKQESYFEVRESTLIYLIEIYKRLRFR